MLRRRILGSAASFRGALARGVSTNTHETILPDEQYKQWEMLIPWRCTSQEKHLVSMIRKAADTQKLVVVFNFRGIRKSTTAGRVAFRARYPFLYAWSCWRLLLYRVVLIDNRSGLTRISETLRGVGEDSKRKTVDILADFVAQHLLVGVVALLLLLTNWIFADQKDEDQKDKPQKEEPPLLEQAKSAFFGSAAEIFVLVLSLFLLRRRRVFIVDDVLSFTSRTGDKVEVQRILNDLKQLGRRYTIVLLSSNEGLPELFSDTNNSTFVTGSFERATSDELVGALNRCNPGRPISSTAFQGICESFGMEHHVYSMRWYPFISNHEFARMVSSKKAAGPALSRSTLRAISLKLDLECESIAGAHALAYSQVVDVRASLKGYFTEDEINAVVEEYGARGPRRLVLTAALLVTGRDAARRGLVAEAVAEAKSKLAEAEKAVPPDSKLIEKSKEYLQAVLDTMKKGPQPPASDEDVAEHEFFMAVRRTLREMTTGNVFGLDEQCAKEVRRITTLVGTPL